MYEASGALNGLAQLAAKGDNSSPMQIQNSGFILPDNLNNIIGWAGMSVTKPNDAELRAPTFKKSIGYQSLKVRPLTVGNLWSLLDGPVQVATFPSAPIPVKTGEELDCYFDNSNTAEISRVFLWLSSGALSPITSPVFTTRATSTTAAVAETWTPLTLTFDENIPDGTWGVCGLRHESATGLACRTTFAKQTERPGVLSDGVANSYAQTGGSMSDDFRYGRFGLFGSFNNKTPWGAEVYCSATDNSHRLLVDLVQLA